MGIMEKLEQMALAGEISEYEKCTIVDMTRKVVEKITAKYENVRKEVTSVMGGKVLEYEAKTILQSGINKGKIEGKIEGALASKKETIKNLTDMKMPSKQIAIAVNLPIKEVERIQKEQKKN